MHAIKIRSVLILALVGALALAALPARADHDDPPLWPEWNLVGGLHGSVVDYTEDHECVTVVFKWDPDHQLYLAYYPDAPSYVNDYRSFRELEPGLAYWVYADGFC